MVNKVTELSVEHVLLFVIAAFLLYYLMGSCGCIDSFSVGGVVYNHDGTLYKGVQCSRKNPATKQCYFEGQNCMYDEKCKEEGGLGCIEKYPCRICGITGYPECPTLKPIGGCKGTEFGCCLDGVTPASSDNDECLRTHKCSNALKKCTKKCKNSKHHKRCMNNCFKDHKKNCKKTCNNHTNKDKRHECINKCNIDCKPLEPIPVPRTDGGAQGACFHGTLNEIGGMPGGKCLGKGECCSVDGFCGKDDAYCLGGYCDNDSQCGSYSCMNKTCQKIF